MHKVACSLFAAAALVKAQNGCDMEDIFADMHDGDQKKVTIAGTAMTIVPHGNNQSWTIHSVINCETGKAVVDFHVPGKPGYPPVPLTAKMFTATGAFGKFGGDSKKTFVFTDPTGTIASPSAPLNQWVQLHSTRAGFTSSCPTTLHNVFADMHDGDKKEVTIDGSAITIKPSGNNQTWVVNANFDTTSCSAMIDFHVPGKPGFPPVPLLATFYEDVGANEEHNSFEFTDPSGTIVADKDLPVNRWIQIDNDAAVVV